MSSIPPGNQPIPPSPGPQPPPPTGGSGAPGNPGTPGNGSTNPTAPTSPFEVVSKAKVDSFLKVAAGTDKVLTSDEFNTWAQKNGLPPLNSGNPGQAPNSPAQSGTAVNPHFDAYSFLYGNFNKASAMDNKAGFSSKDFQAITQLVKNEKDAKGASISGISNLDVQALNK